MAESKEKNIALIKWVKRIGWIGLVFFTLKGIAWLAVIFGFGKMLGL